MKPQSIFFFVLTLRREATLVRRVLAASISPLGPLPDHVSVKFLF